MENDFATTRPAHYAPAMGNDFELKPVIRELVRTRVCFPDILLLVDKITVVDLTDSESSTNTGAYQLYLTDGEVTIQGSHSLTFTVHSLANCATPQPC